MCAEELRDHFGTYGDIESINVKTDPNTGRSRGFAFIVFSKAESLDKVNKIFNTNNELMIEKKKKNKQIRIIIVFENKIKYLNDDFLKSVLLLSASEDNLDS